MTTSRTYTRELRDNLNYTATWLPNLKLSLGSIGELTGYQFTYRNSLQQLGIPFTEAGIGAAATYSYVSSGAVDRHIKLSGKAPITGSVLADADAGLTFSFGRKHAVVFLATGCRIHKIANQDTIKKAVLDAYHNGTWGQNQVVITELVVATNTTIIISEASAARLELRANVGVVPTFEAINTEGSFSLVHESNIGFNCLATTGMTPLFRCLGLRTGLFREDVVTRNQIVGPTTARSAQPKVTLDEVEYDDYSS